SLTVSYIRKFEAPASAGLTLTDGDGPVLVVNRGPHVDTTEAPEGVRISRGPAMCSGPSSCYGTSYALTFEATTTATVYLAEDGDILFGDRPFTVRNLGEVQPVYSDECTHSEVIESGTLWALWRKPRN
ncbi:MAG TPA: hypothetical protein VHU40_20275, partial [Polyangia bacterium]|nr:hypothetical protein [Polyangia bacterium]